MATKRQQTPTRATTGRPPKPRRATTARLIPFPPCRDTRLVAEVLATFQRVGSQRGREAGIAAVEAKHFAPLRIRLGRLGATPEAIEFELLELEAAACDLIWLAPDQGK